MKSKLKSAFITLRDITFVSLLLTGCGGNGPSTLPHVFSGSEVPSDVLLEPRLVPVPKTGDISDQSWPRLGDVPAKPKTFSPQPVLEQSVDELEFDRTQARKDLYEYENPQPTFLPH